MWASKMRQIDDRSSQERRRGDDTAPADTTRVYLLVVLAVDGDLDAEAIGVAGDRGDVVIAVRQALLAIVDTALAVVVNPFGALRLGADLLERVRLAGRGTAVRRNLEHVGCLATRSGVTRADDVRRATRARRGGSAGGRASERATVGERSADGKDDAERHGRGEDSGHRGDDGLDGVLSVGRLGDEPEEHVDHVDNPDGTVEVEAVTEHELPVREGLDLQGLERAVESEAKLYRACQ